ncbi:3-methyl-2-oxobutanoate hydroxymethyltransferase [Spirochaeta africana]|uniref:3-methyl-2-oxobutanoate hydroxymethyltransferase n=1 Tax=Spirochaeta africana (strain ATCC 700263 / DSM 8902 / Z-7692) TaxID=889378 RepID=H9UMW1_SPIAZ|nr:3-methyl-2-oxobutanoate hydroxymethyltransferase [Spirochaeta africana]AFG38854.1 3-methyl-2-oxobutanoate hydroxymethyltransferase [Spirochaeta africana DSM 8902]
MTRLADFPVRKAAGTRLTMLTCYDAVFAALLQETAIDAVLVGDSAAMVMHGQPSTLTADIGMIEAHVRAVRAGAPKLPIVADMPFLSTRTSTPAAVEAAGRLMAAGADGIKIEGLLGHEQLIPHLVQSGIPVMGHLGLTPQSVHVFGGYRVQGRDAAAADAIRQQSLQLQQLGCFGIVLECVPAGLGTEIARELQIPVIGIGAGSLVDGQILVLQDMLGLGTGRVPRFVRRYMDGSADVTTAVTHYIKDVHAGDFPGPNEQYADSANTGDAGSNG